MEDHVFAGPYRFIASEVSLDCPCGERELVLSESGDTVECDCGRVYHNHHYVTVKEPAMATEAVTELKNSKGETEGWQCPHCRQVYGSVAEADGCLKRHASQLNE